MNNREQIVDELFAQAINLSPAEREQFLVDGDHSASPDLLDEVKALLTNYRQAQSKEFLNRPIVGSIAAGNSQALHQNQDFEGYRIVRLLAEGGMGEVYLAEDDQLRRRVALKLIKGHATKDILRRFHSERQILANLKHPHIAQLYEAGATSAGLPFFVMEYVEGQPIDMFAAEQALSITDRLKLFRTVCSAISYAHQNLIIHRDIKPGNILVTESGEAKLLDFGIAKLLQSDVEPDATATQFRAMTPQYASPEQIKGEPISTASDVYSLGVLLYELLTGQRPYKLKGQSATEITKAICEQEATKPSSAVAATANQKFEPQRLARQLRGDLDSIILKALRKEPERRYSSVEQFSEDIRRHLEGLPVTASADTLAYRANKFFKRHKFGMVAAAVIVTILAAGIITTSVAARRARLQSIRAEQRFNQVRELAHAVLFDYHDAIASLPGSTPVRERLVKDALKYLDELSGDPGNTPALQKELATAYLRVGDVQGRPYAPNLGHSDEALASYQKALKILEGLSQNTADRDVKRQLATLNERIGNVQLRKGDFDEAFTRNSKALQLRQELLSVDQNDLARREVADSLLFVGDARQAKCSELKCLQEAMSDQQRALEIRQALATENPLDFDLKRAVAQAHMRIGFRLSTLSTLTKEKDALRQWLAHDRAALAITRDLVAANSTNAIDRRNLADELMATGNAALENNDRAGALAAYQESLEIFSALASADPTNSEAQRDQSFIYMRLARFYAPVGKTDLAREYYQRALKITGQLLAQDPSGQEDLGTAGAIYVSLSQMAEDSGNLDAAIDARKHEIELHERIVALEPNTTYHAYALAAAYQLIGSLYARKGGFQPGADGAQARVPQVINSQQAEQWREARSAYQKALAIYEDLSAKGKLETNYANYPQAMRDYVAWCDSVLARLPPQQ